MDSRNYRTEFLFYGSQINKKTLFQKQRLKSTLENNRKKSCAVVAQVATNVFSVQVDISATIGDVKVAVKKLFPIFLKNVSAERVLLFAAKNENGEFLPIDSPEVKMLGGGDPQGVKAMLKRELELDKDARVDDLFGAVSEWSYVHLLVVPPLQEIQCAVVGSSKGELVLTVDITQSLQSLHQAIAREAEIPEYGLRVFLPVGRDGKWVSYWDLESDDCWALRVGQITDNIEYMMRSEAEVTDPFELAAAARTTKLNLHLLVAVPGCKPRKSASSVLGTRTRHWDWLSLLLAKLKRPGQNGPVSLTKVRWEHIWEPYDELPYKQPCQKIGEDAAKAVTDALWKEVKDLPSFSSYVFQESHLLISAMLKSASEVVGVGAGWELQTEYPLESNLGVVDVHGNADFVIFLGDKCVCVMEGREAEPTGDSSEEQDKEPKELRIMENGLAQVVVAIETINTQPCKRAMGIVTSYRHWKFVKMEYEETESKTVLTTLLVDEDTLTESNYDVPDEQGVARIIGKIAAMLTEKDFNSS